MTREEAIDVVESFRNVVARMKNTEYTVEALDMALTALRPVSRERVEKMRGTWDENKSATIDSIVCSGCGTVFQAYYKDYRFCPRCGQPKTDEAVNMVMERLEALKDGKGD